MRQVRVEVDEERAAQVELYVEPHTLYLWPDQAITLGEALIAAGSEITTLQIEAELRKHDSN